MIILAMEHESPDAGKSDYTRSILDKEARAVWQYQQEGFVRQIFFRDDRNAAVLILEAASVEQAQEQLSVLPLVQSGLINFELIPLKAYPGFERLFMDLQTEQ